MNMPAGVKLATTQNTTVSITLVSTNGFTDKIGLGCASLPAMMTCHFSAPAVSLEVNGTATVQLTIDTNAPVNGGTQASVRPANRSSSAAGTAAPVSVLFGLLLWRRRRKCGALPLAFVISIVSACGLSGCAGLTINSVAPGSYTVQVTAAGTQSAVMRTVNISVDVTK